MSLQRFLKAKRLARVKPTPAEIAGLLETAEQDLADAATAGLSADGKFLFGYGAAQALAAAVVRAAGYKTRGQGHHQTLFAILGILMATEKATARYFDKCREKRNRISYERPRQATATESDEVVKEATAFRGKVQAWLAANHPALLPPAPPKPPASSTP